MEKMYEPDLTEDDFKQLWLEQHHNGEVEAVGQDNKGEKVNYKAIIDNDTDDVMEEYVREMF